jgi:hypothetical protein
MGAIAFGGGLDDEFYAFFFTSKGDSLTCS